MPDSTPADDDDDVFAVIAALGTAATIASAIPSPEHLAAVNEAAEEARRIAGQNNNDS